MTWVLLFLCIWNFIVGCVLAGKLSKFDRHHHGGFTQGRVVQFHEE